MANNIIKRVWNQGSMTPIEDLQGSAFTNEEGGHTFQISGVDSNGDALALSGTVAASFIRPDQSTSAINGSASGGVVSVTLSAECYDVPGRFGLVIFLTSDGKKTAIYSCVGNIARSSTSTASPGTTADVVDLINQIETAVATIPASYSALMADIAPTYSTSALYAVGDYAWYEGDLKRCIVPITVGETYTAAHWTSATIGEDLCNVKGAIIADIPSDESIWDFGDMDNGNGANANSAAAIRTKGFLDKSIREISVETGYRYKILAWENGTYKGGYRDNGTWVKTSLVSWFTTRMSLTQFSSYDLKIEVATTDNSDIAKAAASSVLFNVKLDKRLKTNGVAADAKSTGDKIEATETKLLRSIPHETITKTVASDGKSYWTITNNVASIATNNYVNYRAAKVDVVPKDELTLTFIPFTDYGYIFTDASYNVISYLTWGGNQQGPMQEFKCTVPDGAEYLLINAWGSTNAITVATNKMYETAKKDDMVQAQNNIASIEKDIAKKFQDKSATANILDYRYVQEGQIDSVTGEFTANGPATYKFLATGFIPVEPGVMYLLGKHSGNSLGTDCRGYYYYDEDKAYKNGETGNSSNYWSIFIPPSGTKYIRLYLYAGNIGTNTPSEYVMNTYYMREYGTYARGVPYLHATELDSDKRDDFLDLTRELAGKKIAILGDSIGTRLGYNTPEILIGEDDVGVTLSAYITNNDVVNGLSIAGTTFTSSDVGTEVTFTPTENDIGKSIGTPLNHGDANAVRWWQMLANKFSMEWVNASWSGATMVSEESRTTTAYKASCAWYVPTIRRCGFRTPGSMVRTAPDYIFIHRGVNDFSTTHSGSKTVLTEGLFDSYDYSMPETDALTIDGATRYGFKEAYAMTIQKLRDAYPTATIICCTLAPFRRHSESHFPPTNGRYALPKFNEAIREVAAYYGCLICDFDQTYQYEQLGSYTSDNTHPNEYGHRAMYQKALLALIQSQKVL